MLQHNFMASVTVNEENERKYKEEVELLQRRGALIKELEEIQKLEELKERTEAQVKLKGIVEKNNLNYMIFKIKSDMICISLNFLVEDKLVDMSGNLVSIDHKNVTADLINYRISERETVEKNEFLENLEAGVLREEQFKRFDTYIYFDYPIKMAYENFLIANIKKISISKDDELEISYFKLLKSTKDSMFNQKGVQLKRPCPSSFHEDNEDEELKELIKKFEQFCSPIANTNEAKKPKIDNDEAIISQNLNHPISSGGKEDNTVDAVKIPPASEKPSDEAIISQHLNHPISSGGKEDNTVDAVKIPPASEKPSEDSSCSTSNADTIKQTYSTMFERRGFVSLREMMKLDKLKVEKKEVSISVGKLLDEYIAKEKKKLPNGTSSTLY